MIVDFFPDEHIYMVDGEVAGISVTELLQKHGLSPDYSSVNNNLLEEAADRGKAVHKDLEMVLNHDRGYVPITKQGLNFKQWTDENLDCGTAEQVLGYKYQKMIMAGTADVFGFLKDGTAFVADHKNTAKFHEESVSWQVSLLDYFARKIAGGNINGKPFKWDGATKFFCFHYKPDTGEMKVKELEKVDDSEMEKLLMAEYNGEKYVRPSLVVEHELQEQVENAEKALAMIGEAKKVAEIRASELRAKLIEAMKKQGIKSWDTGKMKATYIAPFEKISIDNKKLKQHYQSAYNACSRISKTKESVRITIRKDEDEE